MEILKAVKEELKIDKDGFSPDRKIYLKTQNCMKQCRTSPNMKADGELYAAVTKEQVLALLKKWK